MININDTIDDKTLNLYNHITCNKKIYLMINIEIHNTVSFLI